jgi:16S rRNA (cytosine1402-N4)-methyltransferase
MPPPHASVLLEEILDLFKPLSISTYVDCTLGAGGHAFHIASSHPELRTIVGIDIDPSAHEIARNRLSPLLEQRNSLPLPPHAPHPLQLKPFTGNYSEIKRALDSHGIEHDSVDAILMDLGVSSMQLDQAERGFSFLRDGPIDMRMGPSVKLSAEEVVNTWSEAQLGRIIREYGEEKAWRQVARRIVEAREKEVSVHPQIEIVILSLISLFKFFLPPSGNYNDLSACKCNRTNADGRYHQERIRQGHSPCDTDLPSPTHRGQ